jgi:hypothetical protein
LKKIETAGWSVGFFTAKEVISSTFSSAAPPCLFAQKPSANNSNQILKKQLTHPFFLNYVFCIQNTV